MNDIDKIYIIIGIIFILISGACGMWWYNNAPYCCIHQCGCTTNLFKCIPSYLINLFIILGIIFIAMGIMTYGEQTTKE